MLVFSSVSELNNDLAFHFGLNFATVQGEEECIYHKMSWLWQGFQMMTYLPVR
jgi:hypothetical protein